MTNEKPDKSDKPTQPPTSTRNTQEETGGFGEKGNGKPEPTRYNDWEVNGRCSDF